MNNKIHWKWNQKKKNIYDNLFKKLIRKYTQTHTDRQTNTQKTFAFDPIGDQVNPP